MEVSMRSTFFHSLRRNQDMLAESLNLDQNDDIVTRSFTALGRSCALYFVEGMASGQRMSDSVLRPLLRAQEELSGRQALEAVTRRLIEAPEVKTEKQPYAAVQQLMRGQTLVLIDTVDEAVLVDLRGYIRRPVSIPQTENVVIGPHEAFTEPLRDNLTLLHRMLPTPRLICKLGQVGTRISTQTAVCYLEGICPQETVDEVQRRLEASAIDHVLTVGELSQLIEDDPFAPLPQVVSTERPDRAAMSILDGRVVVLSDNSPIALILPTDYNSFIKTSDDYYNRWEIASFERLLRYLASFFAMTLPGLYLAVTNFHTQILPTTLLLSFADARSGVPFPAVIEVIIMELSFELLREAGVRLPGAMGNTIGIVGGLIIGQAAVEANLVSPIIVIVISFTALCSFAVPNEEFATAFRLLKFFFIGICAWLGFFGFLAGLLAVLIHLSHLKSFGVPYLMPFVAADLNDYEDERDFLWRQPLRLLWKRPIYAKKNNRRKLRMKQ